MLDINILIENLDYNKRWVKNNIIAIQTACENYLKWTDKYASVDYINEKYKLVKEYQKRVFQIEKQMSVFNR